MSNRTHPDPDTKELRLERRTAVILLIVLTVLFGGVLATAYAAEQSIPGDPLYSVKSSVENTRLRLAVNAIAEGEIHLQLAERRLDELSSLIASGRYDSIDTVTTEFESHIQKAIDSYQKGSSGDPVRAQELALKTAAALARYSNTLSTLRANAPQQAVPALDQAMQLAQAQASQKVVINTEIDFSGPIEGTTSAAWTVGGHTVLLNANTNMQGNFTVGDQVQVHAMVSPDGNLTALTIQAVAGAPAQEITDFTGTIQQMERTFVVIDGVSVAVNSQTRIQGAILIGSIVSVRAIRDANGNLTALILALSAEKSTSTPGAPTLTPLQPTPSTGLSIPTATPQPPGSTIIPVTPPPAATSLPPTPTVQPPADTLPPPTATHLLPSLTLLAPTPTTIISLPTATPV